MGKQASWTSQDISIGDGCNNLGTVTHEIGHALGFFHTQSRYDRDSWVYVDLNNVPQNLQYNFAKMTPATENHFGQPYDFGSVMQYDPYAFAEDPNQYTVTAINMAYQNSMGQREAPAFSDVRMMNWLYNCSSEFTCKLCSQHNYNRIRCILWEEVAVDNGSLVGYCMGVPVPPCRQPGYQDPRNCYSCKCPRAFGGQYCEQLADGSAPNCNGAVVQVTICWC
ncbi:astacin [Necator americanus]|uniref:Metalloendopeptidase n=1 Tax=Necator americanus TaxID=51031 RepID=W2STH7_NECAM|nr:astacin [Necator americanus]ETN72007.1 astacin [Necator americanus]